MSGLELQTKLKSEKCYLPIIFITALGDIPMAVRAIQGGAVDFLTKPIDEAALFNSVERAFEQERANRREATEQEAFAARYATDAPRARGAGSISSGLAQQASRL
jgi:FixJ family two-component response regulator